MEQIKSAEEIINEMGIFSVREVGLINSNVIKLMETHATQYQPKWIEGVPDTENDVTFLLDTGSIMDGYWDEEVGVVRIYTLDYTLRKHEVLAYCQLDTPEIPDHLKAKIK
jgi:hypothetical protein